MYVGDGGGNGGPPAQPGAAVWRNDNMDQPAAALVVAGANGPSWIQLTSSNVADQVTLPTTTALASAGMTTQSTRPTAIPIQSL